MKPSEVHMWRGVLPLIGCFGRSENEMAAAVMVLASRANGDTWGPLAPRDLGEAMKRALEEGELKHFRTNPFAPKPDVRGLVAAGFAEFLGDPDATPPASVQFTQKGLDVLAKTVAA